MLFEHFKLFFPSLAKRAVKHYESGNFELTIQLDDGYTCLYDDVDNTVRRLPNDCNNMSESECKNEFGKRLYKLMIRKCVTQTELSERTGIPQGSISNYITGKSSPSFYNVDKIAKALGCSVDEFRYI